MCRAARTFDSTAVCVCVLRLFIIIYTKRSRHTTNSTTTPHIIIIYYIYFGRIRARTLASLLLPSGSRSVFIPTIKRRKQKAIIIFTLLATHERLAPMASHSQFALTMSIRMDAIGSPSGEEAKKKTESAASEETSHNPIGYTRRPVHLAVGYLGRERVFLQVNTRRYSSSSS